MKPGQTIESDVPVTIALKITKVDKDKREVEGIATQEVVDVHGEIVDHESMKAVLLDWPGNIREMHQPIAVGKAIKVVSDDEAKATVIRARISKGAPDTWLKVEDGTLSMFSIGGTGKRVITKDAAGNEEKRIFMKTLFETSLVDNGACPTAKFQIVKSVDGQAVECQPEEAAVPAVPELSRLKLLRVGDRLVDLVARLNASALATVTVGPEAVTKLATFATAPELIEKRIESYDIDCALSAISMLERLMASEWYEVQEAEFNGTDAGVAIAQLEILKTAIQLVLAFLVSEFSAQFEEPAAADATVANIRRAALIGEVLKKGARHSKGDVAMIQQLHDSSVVLGALCAEPATKIADVPAVPAVPAVPEVPAVPAVVPVAAAADSPLTLESVQKLITDGLQAQKATSDAEIAALKDQVKKLQDQPLPGGPKTRAVEVTKTIAGQPSGAAGEANPAEVIKVLSDLAKDASTEAERERITAKLVSYQRSQGIGVAFSPVPGTEATA